MLAKPTLERGVQRLPRIYDVPFPIQSIYPSQWRSDITTQIVGRTLLELFDELLSEGFIEFKEKLVFVAHI